MSVSLLSTQVCAQPTTRSRVPFPRIQSAPTKYMSLIVPAYNEEERLPAMLDEMLRFLKAEARHPSLDR